MKIYNNSIDFFKGTIIFCSIFLKDFLGKLFKNSKLNKYPDSPINKGI